MEPPRKRTLGVEVPPERQRGPIRPPRKDPRVDSPEPFQAVIPPQAPAPAVDPDPVVPNFRPSMFAKASDSLKRWIAIVTGTVTMITACSVAVVQTYREVSKPSDPDALKACLERIGKVEDIQRAHLDSDESFRRAVGAAFGKNPKGQTTLRGVDQNTAALYSESMGDESKKEPPVWRVSEEVVKLPNPDQPSTFKK